jgi:hypothetical protein
LLSADIRDDDLNFHVDQRLETDKASNASIHYEIAVIKRMYHPAGKVLNGYRPERLAR